MVNSNEDKTKHKSRRSGGSSRASTTRKSHRSSTSRKSGGSKGGGSRSPTRGGEPRRSKRSKEDLEAKDKARAERDTSNIASELTAVDHIDGAVLIEPVEDGRGTRNKPGKSNRRSQQDKGVGKDAKAKVKDLLDRSNEANSVPAPGAHADSRGDEVAKDQKSGKGRFSRPLGTQSVFTMEERARMEAEKGQDQDGLLVANAVDESQDADLAMALLNSMLDRQTDGTVSDRQSKETKKARASKNKRTSDSREESKEEENEEPSDGNKDWESSKLKKGVLVFRFLCCIIVLGAAGIGTWIALRDNNNSMSDTVEPSLSGGASNVTTDSGTVKPPNSTDEPIGSVNPSPNEPSSEPSGPPNSNTGADVITFEPPSEEDCAAVTNGGAIQGQDTMPVQNYLLDLDATPFLPMDLSISAGIIEDNIRVLLTPALTGCDGDVRKLRHEHHRNLSKGFSYAIGNVMVDAVGVEGVSCRDTSNLNCHRVSVTLDIVVKDVSVKVATVITELSLFFGGGVLATKLELAELYERIDVANLGSTDKDKSPSLPDTSSPSMEPSIAPLAVSSPILLGTPILTVSPSQSPTSVSTPLPTSAPVAQEKTLSPTTSSPLTPGPTPPPTPEPGPQGTPPTSLPPTSRPTTFPTPRPTSFPTARPVALPAFVPVADPTSPPSTSKSPSQMPSTNPTNVAVVVSQFPSVNPSAIPSTLPSGNPSSIPSYGPSRTPSSQPSPSPTSGPTKRPSTSPSFRPSTAPSPGPVPISLSTNRCAYLESLLGNRASLHQLAFDWMCNMDTWEPSEEESYPEQWHDRYAVVAYYYGMNDDDPNTFNYSPLSGASTQSTCSWLAGIQSSYSTISCFQNGFSGSKVRVLSGYHAHGVSGSPVFPVGYVPSAIGHLTNLQMFYRVPINRPLPSEIGLLKGLQKFTFDGGNENNYELGSIPSEIGLLTNLQNLVGYRAGLTGTLPSELMNLTKLNRLAFSGNQLRGSIPPSIVGLTNLHSLSLSVNKLTGSIPPSIVGLTNLQSLNLSGNKLTGTIPPLPREQFQVDSYSSYCQLQDNLFSDVTNGVSANCET